MVGMPGYLFAPDPLAVTRMIKNARRSMVPQRGVLAYQDFRGEIIMGAGRRGHTESNRQNGKKELSKPPPFVKAKLECIQVYLWQQLHWRRNEPSRERANG